MRGDDETGAGESRTTRVRTGPRHAAPRKSLLTKIQVPAGKAIAIAAMPTAVLMGMGLTPRLASADELPKNPFSGTSCADTTDEDSSTSSSSSSGSSSSSSSTAKPSASASATATPTPSASSSASSSADSGSGDSSSSKSSSSKSSTPTATASASASASASETTNPLDPLGVGDAIKDLLGLGDTETASTTASSSTPSASATPSATATATASSGEEDSAADTIKKAVKDSVAKAAEVTASADETKTSAASKAASRVTASASSTKTPFPCATHDAAALANAQADDSSSVLPDSPWTLKTDLLTLTGLDYKGIVEVKTYNGTVKKVLKFTATGIDIKNLHQIVDGPNGSTSHVEAASGSTSTITNGTVTMYTESLKGNLFGLIPVEFTPDTPPPINVPVAFFTNVTVVQAGQFGGTLKIPGMHVYNES